MIYPAIEDYIDSAVKSLKEGNIIVYPTDTLYGFGVDATNSMAIQTLNKIKGRATPLSIIIKSIDEIENFAYVEKHALPEINKILPGPYTVLLKATPSTLSKLIYAGSPLIGIRIPEHFFSLEIVKRLNSPIVTTSVNRHNKKPLNDVTKIEIDFPSIDIYKDINHQTSKSSTIVNLSLKKHEIVRMGEGKFPL
tara:strand:+ start:223 stop:804 length:582 start_codon:yes stop_codon:yes gene_type:complete